MKQMKVIMILRRRAVPGTITNVVFHRDFLGAHRYTTGGGTVRPAGGVLRTAIVCRGQPRGGTALSPPVCRHTYPVKKKKVGEVLNSRASPALFYALIQGQSDNRSQWRKAGDMDGS